MQDYTQFQIFYSPPMPKRKTDPVAPNFQALNNESTAKKNGHPEATEGFFTFESNPTTDFPNSSSSLASVSSNRSPFSPIGSHSYTSDLLSGGSSGVEDEDKLLHDALSVLWDELLAPEKETDDSGFFDGIVDQDQLTSPPRTYNKILGMAYHMDLKQLLTSCAEIISELETLPLSEQPMAVSAVESVMGMIEKMVSVTGEPLQRLGAYMLEALRARMISSGSIIYKKLKCNEPIQPTGPELMSYMHVLYQICPYYKFAYMSANVVIWEAMENEGKIHIIDFQIAQGTQWVLFIQALSLRPDGPPFIRITGVDDSQSIHARNGGLEIVGKRLAEVAESCKVPFEFHGAAISGCEVQLESLQIRPEEAIAVNFPYVLHHMPDESVTTANHRDRLLRLVKSLSPKVVTLVEQESNTNTSTFYQRFCEAMDYYLAMFESIDSARARDDGTRVNAEEHCVARDVVNIVACEGVDRVERHELFGKWRMRLEMAGFSLVQLSRTVGDRIGNMLKDHSKNYVLAEFNGALYLRWKNRAMATTSAWR